ncbi:hypothetical protein NPX13_g10995 [Xylaria arbuscula]|uniref:BED-type domain-containing protein n=1 Tax=Xylaria arbuscula TaxID=114810 RepID=A0A9W8N3Z6_9PEZI|nr:hypothetical protein NPX13_g10995 [Xylaria arbuscula]
MRYISGQGIERDLDILERDISINIELLLQPLDLAKARDYTFWTREQCERFAGYIIAHEPKQERKWWWSHGFRMVKADEQPRKYRWVCETCARSNRAKEKFIFMASNSQSLIAHLLKSHDIVKPPTTDNTPGPPANQRRLEDIVDFTNATETALYTKLSLRFKPSVNNLLILDWITYANHSFSTVNDPRWRRILLYNNPGLEEQQLPSHKILISLLIAEYKRAMDSVRSLLGTARGMVHLTFDGWTSRKNMSFVGINAHFIDEKWKKWTILLGLPALVGRHTGKDVADEVLSIIYAFSIASKVGYCTLDNEAKNGTTMAALAQYLQFDPRERHISCAPHTLQLATRSMMHGEGSKSVHWEELVDAFGDSDLEEDEADEFNTLGAAKDDLGEDSELKDDFSDDSLLEDLDSEATQQQLLQDLENVEYPAPVNLTEKSFQKYQRKGPFGKLHNIGVLFNRSSQLVQAFHEAQMQVHPGEPIREWVHNGQTRWQSDETMAARALAEQAALIRMMNNIEELWQQQGAKIRERPLILNCRLTPKDWRVVEAIQKVLSPFKVASQQLQGNGDVGDRETCGRFDEYFPVIEDLLDHLENCVNGEYIEERKNPRLEKIPTLFTTFLRTWIDPRGAC